MCCGHPELLEQASQIMGCASAGDRGGHTEYDPLSDRRSTVLYCIRSSHVSEWCQLQASRAAKVSVRP